MSQSPAFRLARRSTPLALAVLPALLAGCARSPVAAEAAPAAEELVVVRETAPADVRFALDSRSASPISPFVYGVNSYDEEWGGVLPPENLTLSRSGGNRFSAYNWENNASNAGSDWHFQNDAHLGGGEVAGESVRQRVQGALDRGAGSIVTVPMLGYVAADKDGPVGTGEAGLERRLETRFRESRPRKDAPFSMRPDPADRYVYQDEFVWWLDRTFPGASADADRPILFTLDNEPDLWHGTHEEVRGPVDGRPNLLTYDELVERTIATASAIKDVSPGAQVLGPGVATWSGATSLGRWPTPDPTAGTADFLDYYLTRMRAAEGTAGRRLLDVLDLHWYTEVTVDGQRVTDDSAEQTPRMIQARLQAPRSLWDPSYDERSWVNEVTGGPIRLLPRLREKIAAHYPGTRISITEYYYGSAGHISGGIAQADALGVFGREGVYAATLWPLANVHGAPFHGDGRKAYGYLFGAFRMFRDFDGNHGSFGDRSISATTSDVERTSVYASVDADGGGRVVVVAINKTDRPLVASIAITHSRALSRAEVYTLTAASHDPERQRDLALPEAGEIVYTMPPMSVSTLVLR